MLTRRNATRLCLATLSLAAVAALSACGVMSPTNANMVALNTQLRGANEIPAITGSGFGTVDAAFNKDTNVLSWKVNYSALTGPAKAGHFHGPAAAGANAGVALGWASPISNPMEGSATLTPTQAADLLAGRWYANIHTAANPGGEIRGQMMVVGK
jgi:hypothetical protein